MRPLSRRDAVRRLGAAAAILAVTCAPGCRPPGPPRHRVTGTVTHGGKPVALGRIVFEPDATRGNAGPQGFAPIENGRYDTAAPHCKGSVGGPMIVIIDGMEVSGGADASASGRLLFPTHEERIDLPRADATRDFVVPVTATP